MEPLTDSIAGPAGIQTAGEPAAPPQQGPRWGDHTRAVVNTRIFAWSLVLVASVAFLTVAARTGSSIKSGLAVAAVLGVWLIGAALRARGKAEVAFLREYARQRDFRYIGPMELVDNSPLLAAGERHYCDHYMEGPLSNATPDVHFGLAHFTYETYEDTKTGRGNTVEVRTPHAMTICVVEVPEAIDVFFGVYLMRKRGVFNSTSTTWLDFDELRKVELESAPFNRRYDLYVRESQDDYNLLRLFKPTFQHELADLPTELYFEYHQGTLVVYRFKHESAAVELDALIHGTATIARHLREALE